MEENTNSKQEIALFLILNEIVKLNLEKPFTWTSGIKSPIYCNNRQALGLVDFRKKVKTAFISLVENKFPEAEAIAGVATAGIPWSTMIADGLDLPLCYVREKPKGHGLENQIEGPVPVGKKVVVVEDLISTGKSSLLVADVLKEAGCEVIGIAAIFTYGFPDVTEKIKSYGFEAHTITDFETLSEITNKNGSFSEDQTREILQFAKSRSTWKNNAEILAEQESRKENIQLS